jgi:hypothetical protein
MFPCLVESFKNERFLIEYFHFIKLRATKSKRNIHDR